MTVPKVTRDLLMFAPSFSLSPVSPVASARSLCTDKHMTHQHFKANSVGCDALVHPQHHSAIKDIIYAYSICTNFSLTTESVHNSRSAHCRHLTTTTRIPKIMFCLYYINFEVLVGFK